MNAKHQAVTVILADNHHEYRDALKQTLELEDNISVVGEVDNWKDLQAAVRSQQPRVILTDFGLVETNMLIPCAGTFPGDEMGAIHQLAEKHSGISVIILTMSNETNTFKRAIKAGASAYILKDTRSMDIIKMIHAVAQGGSFGKQMLTA